jgi:hypothetical protein
MATRRSSEQWTAIVATFERSNQTVERFCATRGIRPGTFRWWRWRLRSSSGSREASFAASGNDEVRLVPIDVVGVTARVSSPVRIEIAFDDMAVRVEPGADAAYVASLVAELRSRC